MASTVVPSAEPFVMLGWGDAGEGDFQTCSMFYPDKVLPDRDHGTGMTRLQKKITAMRLRYVADLIDPDKVWDV